VRLSLPNDHLFLPTKAPGNVPGFFIIGFRRDRRETVFLICAVYLAIVRYWHKADMIAAPRDVRFWKHSGRRRPAIFRNLPFCESSGMALRCPNALWTLGIKSGVLSITSP
jgi:hypothetical protein